MQYASLGRIRIAVCQQRNLLSGADRGRHRERAARSRTVSTDRPCITRTGGQCRASNYIALMQRAHPMPVSPTYRLYPYRRAAVCKRPSQGSVFRGCACFAGAIGPFCSPIAWRASITLRPCAETRPSEAASLRDWKVSGRRENDSGIRIRSNILDAFAETLGFAVEAFSANAVPSGGRAGIVRLRYS